MDHEGKRQVPASFSLREFGKELVGNRTVSKLMLMEHALRGEDYLHLTDEDRKSQYLVGLDLVANGHIHESLRWLSCASVAVLAAKVKMQELLQA